MAPLSARHLPLAAVLSCGLITAGAGCYRSAPITAERSLRLWEQQAAAVRSGTALQTFGGSADSWVISEEQALSLALRQNPTLRVLSGEAAVARGEAAAARTLENPNLRLTDAKVDRLLDGEAALDLTLRVPVPNPAALGAKINQARLEAAALEAQAEDARRWVRAGVRQAFAQLARLAAEEELLREALTRGAQQNEQQAARLAAGTATELDSALVALRQGELAEELAELGLQRAEVVQQLWALLGVPAPQEARFQLEQPDAQAEARQAELQDQTLIERALARRADLRAAATKVEAATAAAYAARAKRWPWLKFVQLGYELRGNSGVRDFTFGVALDLPLLSWNSGEIAAREARVALRRIEEEQAVRAVAREVTTAISRVEEARRQLALLNKTLLPAAERSATASARAVAAGAAEALKSTVAQEKQLRARRRQLEAICALQCAWIELEAVLAGPVASRSSTARTGDQP